MSTDGIKQWFQHVLEIDASGQHKWKDKEESEGPR